MKKKSDIFFKSVAISIFLGLSTNRGYNPKLYVELGYTQLAMSKNIKKFEECDLITISKVGREREVKLTEKGKKIDDKLNEIKRLLK